MPASGIRGRRAVPDRIFDSNPSLHAEAEAERHRHQRGNGRTADWHELELVRFADMKPRLDGRPLVKGLLEREQISVIYGEAGCGKTFLALDVALHVAAEFEWFGRTVDQGAVIYVAAEAGRSIINRVVAWRTAFGLDKHDLPFGVVTSSIDLCHAEAGDIERLIKAIQAAEIGPIVLVIIDTVSRVLAGGNENSPDDMGALVRSLDRLRDELRCHVSAVHHTGKDTSKGSRGHSLLRCAVDTEIEVARDATGISTATVIKQRDGPTEGQIAFRLRQVELGTDQDNEWVTSCVVEPVDGSAKPPQKKPHKLPSAAKIGLEQLRNSMTKYVTAIPYSDHVPAGAKGVPLVLWREYLIKAGVINEDGNPREQFRRIRVTLQEHGYIGVWGDFVWTIN
jgi:KaiC/GvpD/RAD55 family RecA-like ATPase